MPDIPQKKEMSVEGAFDNINNCSGFYPKKAVDFILSHPQESLPAIRNVVERVIAAPDSEFSKDNSMIFSFALHFLCVFKDNQLHSEILKFLRFNEKYFDELIGDMLTEDMPLILHKTCSGNYDGIWELALDRSAYEYSRSAAIKAMIYGVICNKYSKEKLVQQTTQVLQNILDNHETLQEYEIVDHFIDVFYELGVKDVFPFIEKLYPIVPAPAELDYAVKKLKSESSESLLTYSKAKYDKENDRAFYDRVAWWSFFSDSEIKVGRNDPCPCGSGDKYKKCCLN
jgi:hypothetical protein